MKVILNIPVADEGKQMLLLNAASRALKQVNSGEVVIPVGAWHPFEYRVKEGEDGQAFSVSLTIKRNRNSLAVRFGVSEVEEE